MLVGLLADLTVRSSVVWKELKLVEQKVPEWGWQSVVLMAALRVALKAF